MKKKTKNSIEWNWFRQRNLLLLWFSFVVVDHAFWYRILWDEPQRSSQRSCDSSMCLSICRVSDYQFRQNYLLKPFECEMFGCCVLIDGEACVFTTSRLIDGEPTYIKIFNKVQHYDNVRMETVRTRKPRRHETIANTNKNPLKTDFVKKKKENSIFWQKECVACAVWFAFSALCAGTTRDEIWFWPSFRVFHVRIEHVSDMLLCCWCCSPTQNIRYH